jgi:CBS domain-containing protein
MIFMDAPLSVLLKEKGNDIKSISPGQTIFECAAIMTECKVGALMVMDNGKLAGIISERDILRKLVVHGDDPKKVLVEKLMTKDVLTVTDKTTVREAMHIVTEKRIRHLPVMEDGKLIGLISIGDLTKWALQLQEQQISSLTNYIQGS